MCHVPERHVPERIPINSSLELWEGSWCEVSTATVNTALPPGVGFCCLKTVCLKNFFFLTTVHLQTIKSVFMKYSQRYSCFNFIPKCQQGCGDFLFVFKKMYYLSFKKWPNQISMVTKDINVRWQRLPNCHQIGHN